MGLDLFSDLFREPTRKIPRSTPFWAPSNTGRRSLPTTSTWIWTTRGVSCTTSSDPAWTWREGKYLIMKDPNKVCTRGFFLGRLCLRKSGKFYKMKKWKKSFLTPMKSQGVRLLLLVFCSPCCACMIFLTSPLNRTTKRRRVTLKRRKLNRQVLHEWIFDFDWCSSIQSINQSIDHCVFLFQMPQSETVALHFYPGARIFFSCSLTLGYRGNCFLFFIWFIVIRHVDMPSRSVVRKEGEKKVFTFALLYSLCFVFRDAFGGHWCVVEISCSA